MLDWSARSFTVDVMSPTSWVCCESARMLRAISCTLSRISFMPPTSRSTVLRSLVGHLRAGLGLAGHLLRAPSRLLGRGAHLLDRDGRLRDRRGLLGGRRRVLRDGGEDLGRRRAHARGRVGHLARHVAERVHHAIEVGAQCIQLPVADGRESHRQVARARARHEDLLRGDPFLHGAVGRPLGLDQLLELVRHRVERVGELADLVVCRHGRTSREVAVRQGPGCARQRPKPVGDSRGNDPDDAEGEEHSQDRDHQEHDAVGAQAAQDVVFGVTRCLEIGFRQQVERARHGEGHLLHLGHVHRLAHGRGAAGWIRRDDLIPKAPVARVRILHRLDARVEASIGAGVDPPQVAPNLLVEADELPANGGADLWIRLGQQPQRLGVVLTGIPRHQGDPTHAHQVVGVELAEPVLHTVRLKLNRHADHDEQQQQHHERAEQLRADVQSARAPGCVRRRLLRRPSRTMGFGFLGRVSAIRHVGHCISPSSIRLSHATAASRLLVALIGLFHLRLSRSLIAPSRRQTTSALIIGLLTLGARTIRPRPGS